MDESSQIRVLEYWVDRYQPVVYRAAYLILRDPQSAEDVAQDTFLKAWRARTPIEDEDGVRRWLYRIAVNTALNHMRKKKRERVAVARLSNALAVPDASERLETASAVADAIDKLPDRLRVAIICRYYLELTEEETAQTLRVRPGTVKSRLHEARRLLAGDEDLALAAGRE